LRLSTVNKRLHDDDDDDKIKQDEEQHGIISVSQRTKSLHAQYD